MDTKFNDNLSIAQCFLAAKEAGFKYAALQNGKSCFGDNTYGAEGTAEETECNVACVNDDGIKCGGLNKNSVYDI